MASAALSLRQRFLGSRRATLLGIAIAALACAWALGLDLRRLFSGNSVRIAGEFLSAAFRPALDYENPVDGAEPFLWTVLSATLRTLRFAVLAMTVAIPCGALLGLAASTAWWPNLRRHPWLGVGLRCLYIVARAWIAFARSIHELIWAMLFL